MLNEYNFTTPTEEKKLSKLTEVSTDLTANVSVEVSIYYMYILFYLPLKVLSIPSSTAFCDYLTISY